MKKKIGFKNFRNSSQIGGETMKNLVVIGLVLLFSPCLSLFAQWEPDVRLTYDDSASFAALNNARCVAADGDTLHVVWYDGRDGDSEIYYKRTTDGGLNWETDKRLTNAPDSSYFASVASSGANVHIVWIDCRDGNNELYYKRSTDGGTVWGTDTRLTNDAALSWRPSNAVSGDDVHVVWEDFQGFVTYAIYYRRSTDGGTTWGTDITLSDNLFNAVRPSIAVSDTNVHVVWCDVRDGSWETYYTRSTDSGTTWGTDTRLSDVPDGSIYCSIAATGNDVHVLWCDERDGNSEIYYKRSTDGGTTWGANVRLTNDPDSSMLPSVAVSDKIVHVVWYDNRDDNFEVYYKRSTEGGTNWETDTRLTNDTARSAHPSVVVSDSCVHVIWDDRRDGNREIYYKCNPTGNPVGVEETCASETKEEMLLISPTLFKNRIILKSKESSSKPLKIVLYNVYGAAVFEKSYAYTPHSLMIEDVRVNRLPPSVYFLLVSSNRRKIALAKLIKL